MEMLTDTAEAIRADDAAPPIEEMPREGTPEFEARCAAAMREVVAKYAWIAQQNGFVLRKNPLKLQPYQDYVFNRVSAAQYGFLYRDRSGRRKRWYPNADEILASAMDGVNEFGFIVAERIEFLPGRPEITKDEDGCHVLNLWRPPVWDFVADAPEPTLFLDHIAYLFDGDETAIAHLLNYLAHLLQRPWERVGHALLITSEAKGIGKSTLGTIVRRLVGEQNSRVAQTKDLKGQFDGWLVGRLVVQVDEVYESGNWELANKLKPLITERNVSVNMKYGPQMVVENYARFLLFSNHTAPLNIEQGDRRYFVVNSQAQPRQDAYYDELHRYIESREGMNAIYSFLMRRDLSAFNPFRRPPMTEAKQAVIEVSGNPLRAYIIEAVESGHLHHELGDEFSLDAAQRLLQKDGFGPHAKNRKEVCEALRAAGAVSFRRNEGGRKPRLWRLPPRSDAEEDTDF